ncbi:MAG: hypothetical protein HY431_02005, partial [Candidatus Levybacteria bacterium]|nr:hypothetical protein [Candidatus Levybacteria bacterium]
MNILRPFISFFIFFYIAIYFLTNIVYAQGPGVNPLPPPPPSGCYFDGCLECCTPGGNPCDPSRDGTPGCSCTNFCSSPPPPGGGGEPPPQEQPPPREEPPPDDSGPPSVPTSGAQMPTSNPDDNPQLPTSTPAPAPPGSPPGSEEPPDTDPCVIFPRLPGCGPGSDPPVRRYNISGMIWYDYDQNRKQNDGEPGLDGVRVKADGQDDKGHDDTNNKGKYEIRNLLEGRYKVEAILRGGFRATTRNPRRIGLRSNVRDIDFGAFRGYNISGRVFADINRDGNHDSGEPWLKDFKVKAQHKRSRVDGNDTTNRDGQYTIKDMPNGDYAVSIENLNRNWEPIGKYPKEETIDFGNVRVDFALFPEWTIEGRVFIDGDKDFHFGQNPDDKPLGEKMTNLRVEGRDLTLTENDRENVKFADNGTYSVKGVVPGRYSVRYNQPNGMLVVFPKVGGTAMEYSIEIGDGGGFRCTDGNINPSGGDGRCTNNGSVTNLNFALAFSDSWLQGYGLDMRFDKGLINSMPQTAHASCGGGAYVSAPSSS